MQSCYDSVLAALAGAALVALAPALHAQDAGATWSDRAGVDEGPLGNDVFVPSAEAAAQALFDGDRAWSDSLAPDGARRLERVEAFDLWQRALSSSSAGDSVPRRAFPPSQGARLGDDARAYEGVSVAVLRRLTALSPAARSAFRTRFEDLARAALGAARRDPERLAAVEREHPATRAAATAALWRFEQAFERGRTSDARMWLERCARHSVLGELADAGFDAALARRRAALDELEQRARAGAGAHSPERGDGEAWRDARGLELERTIAYPALYLARATYGRRGLRPDAAFLDDGRVIVQTDNPVFALDPADGLSPLTFLVSELVEKTLEWPYEQPYGRPGGDWPLMPASDGRRIVLVAGRGSALLCLDPPEPGGRPPRIVWALSAAGWRGPGGEREAAVPMLDAALAEARLTFQPGPLVAEGRVLVQVRQGEATDDANGSQARGRERALLVAIDIESGRPIWTRFVALGSDPLPSNVARFGVRRGLERAGEPLVALGGRVFVGTGFGLGALYDMLDGRLVHAFENRRRDGDSAGWESVSGARPAPACDGVPDGILWAPPDSDRLYRLAAGPVLEPGSELVLGPVEPLGTATELVGGDGCSALVLDRSGARRALSAWRAASGERQVSLELGREETFQGSGLVSEARVVLSTDRGVYLFDRARELYLLDVEPLEASGGEAGGSLRAHGERIFAIGRKGLAVLRAVP